MSEQMGTRGNIFANIPDDIPDELFEEISKRETLKIERIVSQGHSSPEGFWYDQAENEWVILLKGSAGLVFEAEDKPVVLSPGDYIDIPAHVKHRVAWTDPEEETIWLAVHYGS